MVFNSPISALIHNTRYILGILWIVQCCGLISPRPARVQSPGWPSKMSRIFLLTDESLGLSKRRCVLFNLADHRKFENTSLSHVYSQCGILLRQLEIPYARTSWYSQTKIETQLSMARPLVKYSIKTRYYLPEKCRRINKHNTGAHTLLSKRQV